MRNTIALSFLLLFAVHESAFAQCPARVGNDSGCGTIITITDAGASVVFTGQGPYDGSDDTLVGVINNSSLPVSAIGLKSGSNIFGFDGDGINTYGVSGNSRDTTGYGGPNAYFTNISTDTTSGTVNFIAPLAPKGGTGYFSLENALTAATACSTVINNSVPKPPGGGVNINATFTPNNGYTLVRAAQLCGFAAFNWVQVVTHLPDPSPFCVNNSALVATNPSPFCGQTSSSAAPFPLHLTSASTPFNDPPPNGYTYGFFNSYPFYYPAAKILADVGALPAAPTFCIEQSTTGCILYDINAAGTTLNFFDSPKNPCFAGGKLVGTPDCGFSMVPGPQGYVAFATHLAGINADGTATDTGVGFTWTSTFNGGTNGTISTGSTQQGDSTGGAGSVNVVSYNGITNYQYPKAVAVTTINGANVGSVAATLLTGSQIAATASGLIYSRATQTYNGTVTITNIGGSALTGPFQVSMSALPAGVILVNATNTFGGFPYITVGSAPSLAAGQSASVSVQFKNPTNGPVNFTPLVYSGSLN